MFLKFISHLISYRKLQHTICLFVFTILIVIYLLSPLVKKTQPFFDFSVTKTCGDSTSNNCTYFQNSGYPSTYDSVGSCQLTVNKCDSSVCQLRWVTISFHHLIKFCPIITFKNLEQWTMMMIWRKRRNGFFFCYWFFLWLFFITILYILESL